MNQIKISRKKIFQIIYALIIVINILILFSLYSFFNRYVYGSFIIDQNYFSGQGGGYGDLNINLFNRIIEKIEKKSNKNDISGIKNIFYQ